MFLFSIKQFINNLKKKNVVKRVITSVQHHRIKLHVGYVKVRVVFIFFSLITHCMAHTGLQKVKNSPTETTRRFGATTVAIYTAVMTYTMVKLL